MKRFVSGKDGSRGTPEFFRARFYRGAKIRSPLIFAPAGILLGSAFPKPCYEKWATMHNLKQMSATLMLYQQYGFSSPDELDAAISAANTATQESLAGLKGLEAAIREKKELQRNLLGYIGTKPARDGLKAQKSEKARRAYREQHESDFIIADTAARYFREHGITKLPASKALQREIEQLTVQKNAGYNDYREKRQRAQELQTVRRNIDQILRGAPSQQKKREQER